MKNDKEKTGKGEDGTPRVPIKERPILFSGPMVRAILDGRKSQTRRVVNDKWKTHLRFDTSSPDLARYFPDGSPYGKPGERLWVRETFYDSSKDDARHPWTYRADTSIDDDMVRDFAWKPSIFMPRKASRITLEIVRVRVDRLQDISEADAKAEGLKSVRVGFLDGRDGGLNSKCSHVEAFGELWESINGAESWEQNPWVWVIEFKKL